jgi:hypothetical protein
VRADVQEGFRIQSECALTYMNARSGHIVLTPEPPSRAAVDGARYGAQAGELRIELKGNLAAMLGAAQNAKRSPETGDLTLQVVMVAGRATR